MATITDVLNSLDQNSKEYNTFIHNLLSNNYDIPFQTEDVYAVQNNIVTAVNISINQESTRCSGLIILEQVLSKCSKDVLLKYGILWITKATQVIENIHSSQRDLSIACKTVGSLIIKCKEIPEIQKQIATQNVKQLIIAIDNLERDVKCGATYYLIAVLLYHYPEICERYQAIIKKMILRQMECEQKNLVIGAAKCYTLLTKAIERSFKQIVAKPTYTGWTYSQALICNSLHLIMNKLFDNLIELTNVSIWDALDLPDISEEHIMEFYDKEERRFLNLCTVLSTMLREYGTKGSVVPTDILQVVCRGLAITPQVLKNQDSFRHKMLYLILPKLHISLLSVLDSLIVGFGYNLIPWGNMILRLFQQTLQYTDNSLEDQTTISGNKPFKSVRISVYKCLKTWLVYTNSLSGIETMADECISCILKDIVPGRDYVLLTVQKTQHLSKRALKRHRDSQYEKSQFLNNTVGVTKNPYLNADLCIEALTVLESIFLSGNGWLKQSFIKNVQNIIVPLLYNIYLNPSEQNFYKKDAKCRLLLLKVLKALEMNPHSRMSPPTQYSIELFETALKDNDMNVIREAQLGLAELEKIVHPVAPSLQLITSESNEREQYTVGSNKRQRMETNIVEQVELIVESIASETNDETQLEINPTVDSSDNAEKISILSSQGKENDIRDSEVSSEILDESLINEFSHCLSEEKEKSVTMSVTKDVSMENEEETATVSVTDTQSQKNQNSEEDMEEEILHLFQDVPKDD